MGVNISPYINYLLGNRERYTGTADQLWDLVKVLENQQLIEKVEGGGGFMYATKTHTFQSRMLINVIDLTNRARLVVLLLTAKLVLL